MSTALYRKYRPQNFDDVVGQDDVVRTLRNAIGNDRLRQAYLFSGPRGTGKTSMARILATALNCVDGPTASPCGACTSCVPIAAGTSLDVIEMDAASQRGIDDVREIRERALLQPISRFKIYILDEAHQLTKDAFNALLKLIEEPPPQLIFIFCTTELDKMLATVRSRCQTLQFARPRLPEITSVLRHIAECEAIEAPDAALAQIAQAGRGSFRDAISTFDQLASATDGVVDVTSVLRLLGVVEEDALFRLVDLVVDGDTPGALAFIEDLAEQGQDLGRVVTDLLEHLRRLLLLRHLEVVPASLPVTEETGARLRSQASQLGEATVLRLMDLLASAVEEEREGGDPRLPLELALVRITRPTRDGTPDAFELRLERLERSLEHSRAGISAQGTPAPAPAADTAAVHATSQAASPARQPDRSDSTAAPSEPGPDSSAESRPEAVEAEASNETSPREAAAPAIGLSEITQLWQQTIIPAVRERSIPTGSVFTETTVVSLEDDTLTLEFPASASFHMKLAEEIKHAGLVSRVLEEVVGRTLKLRYVLTETEEVAPPPPPESVSPPPPEGAAIKDLEEDADPDPTPTGDDPVDEFVTLLKDTFDARELDDD